ncbi:MAG: hypothetical protein H6510_04500 [Acidobacteria bacterium]|nr:hypothetical protein [Acidobacteriota bacterium]
MLKGNKKANMAILTAALAEIMSTTDGQETLETIAQSKYKVVLTIDPNIENGYKKGLGKDHLQDAYAYSNREYQAVGIHQFEGAFPSENGFLKHRKQKRETYTHIKDEKGRRANIEQYGE